MTTKPKNTQKEICCLCGKQINGYGNNPSPVKEQGVCCADCNINIVIPARCAKYVPAIKHKKDNKREAAND